MLAGKTSGRECGKVLKKSWKSKLEHYSYIEQFMTVISTNLTTRVGPMELHRLLLDIRRRVEHEVTYEGTERRTKWVWFSLECIILT